MCERPTSARGFDKSAIGERARDLEHTQEHDRAHEDKMDQESIATLIRFFKLLEQWEREAEDHAKIV